MADAYTSLAQVAVFDDLDDVLDISNVIQDAPVAMALAARAVPGQSYKYDRLTAAPSTGFRAANAGRENATATRVEVTETLKILDASFSIDKGVASRDKRGLAARLATELGDHLSSALYDIEVQLFDDSGDANGFTDLPTLVDAAMTLAAGTATAGTNDVFAIRTGPRDVQLLVGEDGRFDVSDPFETMIEAATGRFPAWSQSVIGHLGLMVGSKYSAAMKRQVDSMTDAILSALFHSFPANRKPNLFVMNRTNLQQLQDSRTATSPSGKEADVPENWQGIPIIATDAIAAP